MDQKLIDKWGLRLAITPQYNRHIVEICNNSCPSLYKETVEAVELVEGLDKCVRKAAQQAEINQVVREVSCTVRGAGVVLSSHEASIVGLVKKQMAEHAEETGEILTAPVVLKQALAKWLDMVGNEVDQLVTKLDDQCTE